MKKWMKVLIIVSALALVSFIFGVIIPMVEWRTVPLNPRIFESIREVTDRLKQEDTEHLLIAPEKLGEDALESYCFKMEYDGRTYTVYAYVFATDDQACAYFCETTGQPGGRTQGYTINTRLFNSSFVAYRNQCAYRVLGGSYRDTVKFLSWLGALFAYPL